MSIVNKLATKGLMAPPKWMRDNTQYECMMGSVAYGVSTDMSDRDIYGFCIPHKDMIFPHLAGEILGFGRQQKRFEQFQQHHVKDEKIEYDITIYSIVKYFQLCMENNPNILDSLFVSRRCILHITQLGEHLRENRKLFLSKKAYHTHKGYAYSQLNKMNTKSPDPSSKRYGMVQKHGYDLKFSYHLVRLVNQAEMLLLEGDLDLERNREQLKSIRRGEWNKEDVIRYFQEKEMTLEKLYANSMALPYKPPEDEIKRLLIECLEMHFGSLDNVLKITRDQNAAKLKEEINQVLNRY